MSLEGRPQEEIMSLAELSSALLGDPNTRREYQKLLKKHNPKLSIPEIDTEDRVSEIVKPITDKMEKIEARSQVDQATIAANNMYEALRDDRVVNSRKEFSELVKYASEKGFQTTDGGLRLAAQYRSDELAHAEPTPHSAAAALIPRDNKDLMKDPQGWARNQANQAMADIMKNRGRKAA